MIQPGWGIKKKQRRNHRIDEEEEEEEVTVVVVDMNCPCGNDHTSKIFMLVTLTH